MNPDSELILFLRRMVMIVIKSGFFTSINGDRRYGHSELNKPLLSLISDGVIPNRGNALQVMANNNDTIKVMSGIAHCYGHWMENTAVEVLEIPQSDYVYDRIDRVVIRCDETEDVRDMFIYIKHGQAKSNPEPPALEKTDSVKEMCLAEIYVKKQTGSIKQSDITDTRANTAVCGWVVALIDKVDTSTLYLQWKKAYEDYYSKTQSAIDGWFSNIKENLNGIGVLREYKKKFRILSTPTDTFLIDVPMFDPDLDILNVYINGLKLHDDEYSVVKKNNVDHIKLKDEISSTQNDELEIVVMRSVDDVNASIVKRFETELMRQKDAANRLIEQGNALVNSVNSAVSELNRKLTNDEFRGQQGIQGIQGEKGDKGDTGESGITTPVSGMYTLSVDADGNLYANYNDEAPVFSYDSETGALYYEI